MLVQPHAQGREQAIAEADLVLEVGAVGPRAPGAHLVHERSPCADRHAPRAAALLLRLEPERQRVRLVQVEVVLPVELDDLAFEVAVQGRSGVERVNVVLQPPVVVREGHAHCLLPHAVAEREPALEPAEEHLCVEGAVRVVSERSAEVVEVPFGVHVSQDQVEPEVLRRRESQAGGEGDVLVAVLLAVAVAAVCGRHAARLQVGKAQRVVEQLRAAQQARRLPVGIVGAALDQDRPRRLALAPPGDDVDHAADGIRAVEGALRTADDLDALDVVGGQVGEVE